MRTGTLTTSHAARAAALALVVLAALVASGDARELAIAVPKLEKGIADDGRDDLPMAGVRFDEPLPRYLAPTAMFSIGLLVGYMYLEGLLAVALCGAVLQGGAFLFYFFAALGADTDAAVWQYPLANAKPILTNQGAVGGLYFGLAFWCYALFGGVVGEVISWAVLALDDGGKPVGKGRPYDTRHRYVKMASMKELVGRGCANFLCPAYVNRDAYDAPPPAAYAKGSDAWGADADDTPAARGVDDSYVTNACMATSGGEQLTWGVTLDHLLVVAWVGFAVGPGMDVWQLPELAWVGWAILLVVLLLVVALYQYYHYGEAVDHSPHLTKEQLNDAAKTQKVLVPKSVEANLRRIYARLTDKVMVLYPPFVHIVLFNLAYAILYSAMGAQGAFVRVRYAQDAAEARYLANQNLLLEFVTVTICFGVLLAVAVTTYFVVIKNALPAY